MGGCGAAARPGQWGRFARRSLHTQVADSKLLKILAKIAGQLTDLKDVITITEPCARKPQPRPSVAATLICCPLLLDLFATPCC